MERPTLRILPGVLADSLVGCLIFPKSAHGDSKSDARRAFNEGMRPIESGRLRQGIDLLESAYATLPHPSVLFNLGRAYASLGDLDQSIAYFERYRSSNPPDMDDLDRTLDSLRTRRRLRHLVNRSRVRPAEPNRFRRDPLAPRPHLHGLGPREASRVQRPA